MRIKERLNLRVVIKADGRLTGNHANRLHRACGMMPALQLCELLIAA